MSRRPASEPRWPMLRPAGRSSGQRRSRPALGLAAAAWRFAEDDLISIHAPALHAQDRPDVLANAWATVGPYRAPAAADLRESHWPRRGNPTHSLPLGELPHRQDLAS